MTWGPSQPDAEPRRSFLPGGCPRAGVRNPRRRDVCGQALGLRWPLPLALPYAKALRTRARCLLRWQRDASTHVSWGKNQLKS